MNKMTCSDDYKFDDEDYKIDMDIEMEGFKTPNQQSKLSGLKTEKGLVAVGGKSKSAG